MVDLNGRRSRIVSVVVGFYRSELVLSQAYSDAIHEDILFGE